ncbi:MAG: DNA mismatch endonuclease Vsr [Nitrospira sp.]|nr:DNA mismatch endonuclease Vsr [Nitrospira sp.]
MERSEIMRRVKSHGTEPELLLRKHLFAAGIRYRVNVRNVSGKPDICIKRYKVAIFVHGCFWHGHGCRNMPKTNTAFWRNKIMMNRKRDDRVVRKLRGSGWNVLAVWECEMRKKAKLERIIHIIVKTIRCLRQPASKKFLHTIEIEQETSMCEATANHQKSR